MNPEEKIKDKDRSITPTYIVVGLVLLNLLLGLLTLAFPDGKREIFGIEFKFVSPKEIFTPDSVVVVNTDSVLADISVVDTNQMALMAVKDSLEVLQKRLPDHRRIHYSSDNDSALYNFFAALSNCENTGELIRILHYGDSQLEGDRISDYLRNRMQLRFGGYGPGIVLPMDISRSRVSVRQRESQDWVKYAVYGNRKRLKNGYYGIGASSYKFAGEYQEKIGEDTVISKIFQTDTTVVGDSMTVTVDSAIFVMDTVIIPKYETREVGSSWLSYRNATRSYPRVRKIKQARLLYAAEEPISMNLQLDGSNKEVILKEAMPFGMKMLGTDISKGITLSFNGGVSPYIYGVALDGDSGVAVDNFPMRGSSGLGFERINQGLLHVMVTRLNAKLIIMQYGINVIPNPQKNYAFYERMFGAQLKALKKANPDVSILVIGPSDMSRKEGSDYVSYPNITLVRDAMKKAAFANGCAFWDLYEAMGGENSMVGWVQSDPTLASLDYTHFNSRGARYVGEMLYEALILEYELFVQSKKAAGLAN